MPVHFLAHISQVTDTVVETRVQNVAARPGEREFPRMLRLASGLVRQEGFTSLYKGLGPRLLRVGPGQAVSFTAYEFIMAHVHNIGR